MARVVSLLVPGLLAVALLFMATPRLIGTVVQLPGDPIVDLYKRGLLEPDADDLEIWGQSRLDALAWKDSFDLWYDLSTIEVRRIGMAGLLDGGSLTHYVAARDHLETALAHNPANAYAWMRLSILARALGDHDVFDRALAMSILTGPRENRLHEKRISLSFRNWDLLKDETRTLAERDVVELWIWKPHLVGRLVRNNPEWREQFQEILGTEEIS